MLFNAARICWLQTQPQGTCHSRTHAPGHIANGNRERERQVGSAYSNSVVLVLDEWSGTCWQRTHREEHVQTIYFLQTVTVAGDDCLCPIDRCLMRRKTRRFLTGQRSKSTGRALSSNIKKNLHHLFLQKVESSTKALSRDSCSRQKCVRIVSKSASTFR